MSRDYKPAKKIADGGNVIGGCFNANVCGCDMLAEIVKQLNMPGTTSQFMDGRIDPPWRATAEVATAMANRLKETSDERIAAILPSVQDCFDGTAAEFVEWVRDWQRFLSLSGGYKVLG